MSTYRKESSALVSLDGVKLPNLTNIATAEWVDGMGLKRMPDIVMSGVYDDACSFPLGSTPNESKELVIKFGRKRFSVPVVVKSMTTIQKRRARTARWEVTLEPIGPGAWAQPKRKPAKKERSRA